MEHLIEAFIKQFQTPSTIEEIRDLNLIYKSDAFQNLFRHLRENTDDMPAAIEKIADALGDMDMLKACCGAYFCGSLIEQAGVGNAGFRIVDFYAKIVVFSCEYLAQVEESLQVEELDSSQVAQADLGKLFAASPDHARAYAGCDLATLALMAVATKDQESRMRLRSHKIYRHLQYLQQFIENTGYVTQVHDTCPKMELTVLAPAAGKGFIAQINDLSNCFHLFTLLEAELFQKGQAESYGLKDYRFYKEIYQIAAGTAVPQRNYSIQAHQQYYTYQAVQKDGSYVITVTKDGRTQVDEGALIWGEMPPEAIPRFEGEAMVIMDAKGMFGSRSWDVSFIAKCHDALTPYMQITRELSKDEVDSRMDKIKNRVE